MTEQDFIAIYGQSVYEVRLEVAMKLLADMPTPAALDVAEAFVNSLLDESKEELRAKFDR